MIQTEFELFPYKCRLQIFVIGIYIAEIVHCNIGVFFFKFFKSTDTAFKFFDFFYGSLQCQSK